MRPFDVARGVAVAAFLAAFAMAPGGCVHSSGSVPPMLPPPNNPFNNSNFIYDAGFMEHSHYVKPASFSTMGVDVIVKLQNPLGIERYAAEVRDPQSGVFGQYLTPAQIADRFFATASDYAAARKYLERHGLKVTGWPQRFMLYATGTQQQLEQAFSTKFAWYKHRNETFLGPTVAPSVPKNVPIIGSFNIVHRTKTFTPSMVPASNGLLSGYSPQQIQLAFDYAGAYNLNYFGSGITIGIIGTGPVSIQSSTHLGDLEAMRALYHAQGTNTITEVATTGAGFASPPPVTKACNQSSNPNLPPWNSPTNNCNPEDGEAQLDTQQAALLAPAAQVKFYLAYVPSDKNGYTEQGLPLAPYEIQTALADNTSDVLSLSFGADEVTASTSQGSQPSEISMLEPMFAQGEAQGISIFASAGDYGAYACQDGLIPTPNPYENDLCVSYPATDQNVTAVGGVTTPLNSAGQFIGPIVAWGESTTGGVGGTGGGISRVIPIPKYQQVCPVPRDNKGCPSGSFRNVPDVSLDGDPLTGVAVVAFADPSIGPRQIFSFGGTSVAAPEMAAMWAEVLGVCKIKAGFCGTGPNSQLPYRTGVANPYLYNIFAEKGTQTYESTFFDVLYGTNGGFPGGPTPGPTFLPGESAGKGYDLATGIGVPFTRALIKAVAGL